MPDLLTRELPALGSKILGPRSGEDPVSIDADMWETRIDPLLFELKDLQGVRSFNSTVEGREIFLMSNDEALLASLQTSRRTLGFVPAPRFKLYVFSGISNLSILRRFKDFPDETPREDLEAFWLAECPENGSVIVLNRDR